MLTSGNMMQTRCGFCLLVIHTVIYQRFTALDDPQTYLDSLKITDAIMSVLSSIPHLSLTLSIAQGGWHLYAAAARLWVNWEQD